MIRQRCKHIDCFLRMHHLTSAFMISISNFMSFSYQWILQFWQLFHSAIAVHFFLFHHPSFGQNIIVMPYVEPGWSYSYLDSAFYVIVVFICSILFYFLPEMSYCNLDIPCKLFISKKDIPYKLRFSTLSVIGKMNKKGKQKSAVAIKKKVAAIGQKGRKRTLSEEPVGSRTRPKRAAACSDFKEKSIRLLEKSCLVEQEKKQIAEEEILAVRLTSGENDNNNDRPNRRLADFILHDQHGAPQPPEMLEVDELFISGNILPLEESSDKEKEKGVRCEGFGRVESWDISGYEDGFPVIWLSTDVADYDCRKPASSYRKFYDPFFEKARVCVEVYKRVSESFGGNPDSSLDELLAGVVRSMSGNKSFTGGASIRDFVLSQGEFVYNQLIGLDETAKKNDKKFVELPGLVALRDYSRKSENFMQAKETISGGVLRIDSGDGDEENETKQSVSLACASEEGDDAKLARLLQEEEYWKSMKQRRNRAPASSSNKFYIKINEDELVNDYPLPAYYKNTDEETDEFIVFDNDFDVLDTDELPRSMLHNWALYNSDSRLISLELLPMKPCADIDVTIFGSGVMTADDGSGFCLDADSSQSSSGGSGAHDVEGMPIYLSAIKEWMIEFGSSMIFISIRTDMAWYSEYSYNGHCSYVFPV